MQPFSGDGHQTRWSRSTGLGRGVKHPADPAVSGESIAQGSRPKCDGHFARPPARGVFSPGFGFLGPGCPHPDRVETERDAISHANGAGRSATKRCDAVVRLFYRETARRPQRVRPDLRADVTAHITSLPGECEPALDLKSVGGARYA